MSQEYEDSRATRRDEYEERSDIWAEIKELEYEKEWGNVCPQHKEELLPDGSCPGHSRDRARGE